MFVVCSDCRAIMDAEDVARGPRIKTGPHAGLYEKVVPDLCEDCYDARMAKTKTN